MLTIYSFGLHYIISYLFSFRSVSFKHLPGPYEYNVNSLTLVAEVFNEKGVVLSVVHGFLGLVSCLWSGT
jgi:hypothetical protein